MSEQLIRSVDGLLRSLKTKGGQFNDVLNALKQANSLFPTNQNKLGLELRNLDNQNRILKIIERFTNEFESDSLPKQVSVKNYLIFFHTVFRIAKKLKPGYYRSLIFATTLSKLNEMFRQYPLQYPKRKTNEPLRLLFLITEAIHEASRNLKTPYVYEDITSAQFIPLVTKYCISSGDPLQEILDSISKMPKFRMNVSFNENHQKIVETIVEYCFPKVPLENRIQAGTILLAKITSEPTDSRVALHFKTLKMLIEKDNEIGNKLSEIAKKEIKKTNHRRFVKGILDEISHLGN